MIDFILSKMGILLFAVAMAGILLYFSGSIKNVFLSDETIQISNVVAKQINYMAQSDNLCASTKVILPKHIDIFGISGRPTFSSIYYKMDINVVSSPSSNSNFVVFSIYDKQSKKQIALESFRTSSEVSFGKGTNESLRKGISIDPTAHQVVYMVKSKSVDASGNLKTTLYFIYCDYNIDATAIQNGDPFKSCYTKLSDLQKDSGKSSDYPFFCVPQPDTPKNS